MSAQRDLERLLDGWLGEGPSEAPDRVIDAVVDRIARQPQRGAWRLGAAGVWGGRGARLAAAAIGSIVVAGLGLALLGTSRSPNATAPTAPPSASPSTASSSATSGRYRNETFGVGYEVPFGWVNARTSPVWVVLGPTSTADESLVGISLFRDAVIADQDAACDQTQKAGVGHTVDDFVSYLEGHPGLMTTPSRVVSIGGLAGRSIDLSLDPGWTQACPFNGRPTVMFLTAEGGASYLWGADDVDQQRVAFLDDGAGGAIVVILNFRGKSGFEEFAAIADPIIDSLVIERRPRSAGSSPAASR